MDKTNAKQIKSLIIITRGIITRKSFPHPWKFIDYTSTLGVGNFCKFWALPERSTC